MTLQTMHFQQLEEHHVMWQRGRDKLRLAHGQEADMTF